MLTGFGFQSPNVWRVFFLLLPNCHGFFFHQQCPDGFFSPVSKSWWVFPLNFLWPPDKLQNQSGWKLRKVAVVVTGIGGNPSQFPTYPIDQSWFLMGIEKKTLTAPVLTVRFVTGIPWNQSQFRLGESWRSVTGFGGPCRPKTLAKKMIKTWIWRNWVTHPKPHTCDQESHYQTGCPSVGCCWLPSCCESWGATKTRGKLYPLALGALQGSAGAFSGSKPARKNRLNNSLLETL